MCVVEQAGMYVAPAPSPELAANHRMAIISWRVATTRILVAHVIREHPSGGFDKAKLHLTLRPRLSRSQIREILPL